MSRVHLPEKLLCALMLASGAASPSAAPANQADDPAGLEARLAAARAKLEAAAREVAELSGELTGPVMEDFLIAGHGFGGRAMLGINIADDDEEVAGGVRVRSVTPGGPASDAGLKAGDLIVSIDGKELTAGRKPPAAALIAHMRTVEPGDKVKLDYLRDGKRHTAEITSEAWGDFRPRIGGHPLPRLGRDPFTLSFRAHRGAGFFDMELVTLTPKLGRYFGTDKGVLVVRPPRSSELKLEEGDVIVDIDGRAPQNGGHALRILRSYQPGENVTLNVMRDRKRVKLVATMPKEADPEVGALRVPGLAYVAYVAIQNGGMSLSTK